MDLEMEKKTFSWDRFLQRGLYVLQEVDFGIQMQVEKQKSIKF